jgi:copper(I)-binding protein
LRIAVSRSAILLAVLLGALAATGVASAGGKESSVQVREPWARATPPGVQVAAVFFTLRNAGAADRLLSVATPASKRVEIHQTTHDDGQMRMRAVGTLEIPAGAEIVFAPGGLHVMVMGLEQPFRAGERVALTLVFERAGSIAVQADIAPIGAMGPGAKSPEHAGHH